MIKIENVEVVGWEPTIRGMRNPKNSWEKSDSCVKGAHFCSDYCGIVECHNISGLNLGPNDLDLMSRLAKGGPVHAKYRRMITVYLDITAPLYWWKEFDTYKVGTVANSCSTMHKIHEKEFTLDDFSHEHLMGDIDYDHTDYIILETINALNYWRNLYLEIDKDIKEKQFHDSKVRNELIRLQKRYWWQMIQLLPSSYNQRRTIMLNYEVLTNIYESRKNHKLDEWRELCKWIEILPYSEIITGEVKESEN